MAISNFFNRIMPKGSNPSGAVKTSRKKFQVLSQLKAVLIGLGRRLRVVNTERKLVENALGRHLPEVPLSARFGVEAKLANIMSGHAFDAFSSKGVELSSRAAAVVRDMSSKDGIYVKQERVSDSEDESTVDGKLTLVRIGKKALKDRRTDMVKARNQVNRQQEAIFKAENSKSKGYEDQVQQLKMDLESMKAEQQETRENYMVLRQAAVELKIAEIKEQYDDSESASILEELEAQLATMKASAFGDAASVVRSSATKKWENQIDLRRAVDQVPQELRRMVYKDVKEYLVSDENYLKMLDAQSKHQMIDGTQQLRFVPGVEKRLPGLPYYMAKVNLDPVLKARGKEECLIEAAKLMEKDWGSFLEPVLAERNKVMVKDKPATDTAGAVEGEFNHGRIWDYFNITAYTDTLNWTKELQADRDARLEIITDFGEELGIRRPYRNLSQDDFDARQRLKIAQEYNLTVGGEAQDGMFPSVRYVASNEEVEIREETNVFSSSESPAHDSSLEIKETEDLISVSDDERTKVLSGSESSTHDGAPEIQVREGSIPSNDGEKTMLQANDAASSVKKKEEKELEELLMANSVSLLSSAGHSERVDGTQQSNGTQSAQSKSINKSNDPFADLSWDNIDPNPNPNPKKK